jgi:hypothetical protein
MKLTTHLESLSRQFLYMLHMPLLCGNKGYVQCTGRYCRMITIILVRHKELGSLL